MVPFIDLRRQYHRIEKEILGATRRVYGKGRYILGEEVAAFEKEFARYCGVRYAVGVASGTDALYLSLKAAGIGEGDEVITPAHSFVSSALAVSFAGATPLFVDIDPRTYTLDPNELELLLKRRMAEKGWQRVKAVLPVHLYGHPAEMGSILEIANRYGLLVIEDACQAHGATYGRKKAGAFGAFGCFSFYPTKNLGAYGDGGIVVTNHQKFYERLRLLRCYGEKKKYHHTLKGGNSRLDELQAAILRVKLRYLDRWNEERRKRARFYTEKLAPSGVVCPFESEAARHVYHLYVIRTERREALEAFLKERGIVTLIHYPVPIHRQKIYRELGYRSGDLPLTEQYSRKILSLPIFPEIRRSEIEEVVKGIQDFVDGTALPTRPPAHRQGRKAKERGASD
jgi:dTDP-4-amino-4,6-dideoxygalactose transaminase